MIRTYDRMCIEQLERMRALVDAGQPMGADWDAPQVGCAAAGFKAPRWGQKVGAVRPVISTTLCG